MGVFWQRQSFERRKCDSRFGQLVCPLLAVCVGRRDASNLRLYFGHALCRGEIGSSPRRPTQSVLWHSPKKNRRSHSRLTQHAILFYAWPNGTARLAPLHGRMLAIVPPDLQKRSYGEPQQAGWGEIYALQTILFKTDAVRRIWNRLRS